MTGHQNALALSQEVSHQVRNGMCLACAGRALHQNSIIALNSPGDLQLFLIGFFGKQNIYALTADCCKLFLNRSFSGILGNINFPALDNIADWGRHLAGFLDMLNNLLNGFQSTIHAFPQDIAWITVQQESFFFLPVIRNTFFGIEALRRKLMNKYFKKYRQLITIQGMIIILVEVVPHMVNGRQIDAVHALEHYGVQLSFHIGIFDIYRVRHCIMPNLYTPGQNRVIQFGHIPIPEKTISDHQLQGFRLTLQINADLIKLREQVSGFCQHFLLFSPHISLCHPGMKC